MKTEINSPNQSSNLTAHLHVVSPEEAADLDAISIDASIKWLTVPGFMRSLQHSQKWGINNVSRFGKAVNQAADAFGMTFKTTHDPVLGSLRVFPVSLLGSVYGEMYEEFGWPTLKEATRRAEALKDAEPARAELKLKQALIAQARMMGEHAQEAHVRKSAKTMIGVLEVECAALQAALAVPAATPELAPA